MKVKDIMTAPAVSINSDATVEEAAKVMRRHNIGSIPVTDDSGKLSGVLTDRDIVIRAVARGMDIKERTVNEIMTQKVVFVSPKTDIEKTARTMAHDRIRRLPVIEHDRLVGVIALGDIAVCTDFAVETSEALSEISEGCHKKYPSKH